MGTFAPHKVKGKSGMEHTLVGGTFEKRQGKRRSPLAKKLRASTRGDTHVPIFGEKQLGMTGKQKVAVQKARAKLGKNVKRTTKSIWRKLI
jgi:hypothetical protein